MRVIVIGGGIIGTLAAYRIRKRYPDIELKIVADKLSPDTTSDISAGWLKPHLDPETPAELTCRWTAETYQLCTDLWRSTPIEELDGIQEKVAKCVSMFNVIHLDSDPEFVNQFWRNIPIDYHVVNDGKILKDIGFKSGQDMHAYSFLSFTLEPMDLLPVLYEWLRENNVDIELRKVNSLQELEDECDVVVNCSGIGSHSLVNDANLYPISGQVIRVKVPGMKMCAFDNRKDSWAYIIPNRDTTILGSVDITNNWDTTVRTENTRKILTNCNRLCPLKGNVEIVSERVGLRPCRKGGVRLEAEKIGKLTVIHNYGHGGSGITLSWGCARDVVNILENIVANRILSKL